MGSTYLELTNELLRSFNQVELTEFDFLSARGVQARAKDAVRATINLINQQSFTWPFNAVERTQLLTTGINEYSWPEDFNTVDFKSFQLQADPVLNIKSHQLQDISKDEWYDRLRDSEASGLPQFVFQSHGEVFGISPKPDNNYIIKYRYFANHPILTTHSTQTNIPTEWNHVIMIGGAYHMHLFRDNPEVAVLVKDEFNKNLASMRRVLLREPTHARDGRIRF